MEQRTQITNRYQVIDKIGQGGMGAVWRVYDRLEQNEVALKQVLIPEKQLAFASKGDTDDLEKIRLNLAREFSLLATLRHPYILSVLDFGFDDKGHPFYTMTLLEGSMDFKSYAEGLPQNEKIRVLTQMLQALHYLHRRGILHRDLKPDNVLIDKDGQVKVMDFGLAKKDSKDEPQSNENDNISGTIKYMSPELFHGEQASVGSDLYAFGLMAYEILTGKYPYKFDKASTLIFKLLIEKPNLEAIPEVLFTWMGRLLERDPNLRFESAYDVLQNLYDAQDTLIPSETQIIRESFLQASEFIGRDAELTQLIDGLEQMTDDATAFFLVGGESGVGKSRLLDELRIEALVRNALVMRGQGVEGSSQPFQLWCDIIRRMLLVVEVTDLQAGILKDLVPDLNVLLQREIIKAPELTGKTYQDRMVLTIVDLFRNLSQPIILLLEDLQWASDSLAVVQQILKIPEQLPKLMVVANYRDDEVPDLPAELTGMTHIKLDRLTPASVSELSRAMLGDVGTNEKVVQLLYSQSEGNLFFLVDTVRMLAETSGDLQQIGQGELPQGVFTGGMQAITRRRLSKVDVQYSAIQTLAAVIGREINVKLLVHVYGEARVDAWLNNASAYDIVSVQDNIWRFAHDKLRETVIADISDDALPDIHRTAAETIEAVYPDDKGYNEALLTHWQQANNFDKIYHYAIPVVENMITIKATYTIADALLQRLLDSLPADDARCITLWNWLANSAYRQRNYNTSKAYAEQVQQLASLTNNQEELAMSLNTLGLVALSEEDFENASDLHQQSLELRQQLDDQNGIADNLINLGNVAKNRGDTARAVELYEQSLAIKQKLGDQRGIAGSLYNLGDIALRDRDYNRARDLHQQSLELRQQLGDQRGIADSLYILGDIAYEQGDYVDATELYQKSLVIEQQLGNQFYLADVLNILGLIAYRQEDYDHAIDLHSKSLTIKQQLGDQRGTATSLNNLGLVAHMQEDYDHASELYQKSLVIEQELDDQWGIALNLHNLGRTTQKQGQSAQELFHRSLAIAHDMQITTVMLLNMVGFAHYFIAQDNLKRAIRYMSLAQNHPARNDDVRIYLDEIRPLLSAVRSPDDLQTALEQSEELDLDTVAQELLDEFSDKMSTENNETTDQNHNQ